MGGVPGAAAWAALKLLLPFAGIIGGLICLIRLLGRHAKSLRFRLLAGIAVSCAAVFPLFITLNLLPMAYPARLDRTGPAVTLLSPLGEEAIVAWGGNTLENNLPHAMWASERWAYDLVMEPYDTGSPDLSHYGIWGKPVFSPVTGLVVAAYDGDLDIPPNTEQFQSLEGNYVYIEIAETGTYLLLNHLAQGSVVVAPGDALRPGDLLGLVGNSGTSSEPHLHIHHQRQNPAYTLHPLLAEGLPLYFRQDGHAVMPEKGEILTP